MLVKLPIPILYRILNNPKFQKIDHMDDSHKNQIFEFMFKCLDEHKRSASILFKNCKLNDIDIINRLLNDYIDIFDFNMINSETTVKKIPEMLSEINKMKIEHSKFLSDAQNRLDFFLVKMNELTNIIHIQNEEIGELKETINLQKKEINDLKETSVLQISNNEN